MKRPAELGWLAFWVTWSVTAGLVLGKLLIAISRG